MVVMSKYMHTQCKNGTNYQETFSGMNCFISRQCWIALRGVMHLKKINQARVGLTFTKVNFSLCKQHFSWAS